MARHNGIHPIVTAAAIVAVLALLAYIVFGGSRQRDIVGTWVTDTSTVESGFRCGTKGIASTINNTTYQYNTWKLHHNNLILSGKEFRDKQVLDFSDTLKIKKLTSKALVVEHNGQTTHYKKTL